MSHNRENTPSLSQRLQALAERDPRRATIIARRAVEVAADASPAERAQLDGTLGWALLCWEQPDDARPHLASARAAFERLGMPLDALRCEYALRLADMAGPAEPELDLALEALAQRFLSLGAPHDAGRAQLSRATFYMNIGRTDDAGRLLEQLAPQFGPALSLSYGRWLYLRGSVAVMQSRFADAGALLAQAEEIFAQLRHPLDRAKCWYQQAWCALRQELVEQAVSGYQRAQQTYERLEMAARRSLCDKALGLALARLGRYDEALRALLGALRTFTALRRISEMGACYLNIGNIYFYNGLWDVALTYYSRADRLYELAGMVSERSLVRRNQSMVYRNQGNLDLACAVLKQAERALAGADKLEMAELWSVHASLLADVGQLDEAVQQYAQARELFVEVEAPLDAAECDVELGWLLLRCDDVAAAERHFRAAAPMVAPQPYYQWRNDYGLARCAERRDDLAGALGFYRSASAVVATLRRRLASEISSSGLYAQAAQLHADSLRCAMRLGRLEDLLAFIEQQRALALQRARSTSPSPIAAEDQADLQVLRAQIEPLLAGQPEAAPALDAALADYGDMLLRARSGASIAEQLPELSFDLSQLRARLSERYGDAWSAVSYTVLGERLLIVVLTPDAIQLTQAPFSPALERALGRLADPQYMLYIGRDLPFLQGRTPRPWDSLQMLAEQLLPGALRARLQLPQHRLLIVPSGPLHAVPWAMLRLGDSWLAERAIIHILPSLTIGQALLAQPAPRHSRALLLGCAGFDDRGRPLPSVADELADVAARWPGEHAQLFDTQATRAALLERVGQAGMAGLGLLHIASHAQMLPRRGMAAHLKLADGDLWLADVAGLRLDGALAVLSTCEGAAADALPGDEVLSLNWTFLAAGAGGVLASLWPVEDMAVRRFMALFYDLLGQHGDAALALAGAQRALAQQYAHEPSPLAEPLCWGSFTLMGGYLPLW